MSDDLDDPDLDEEAITRIRTYPAWVVWDDPIDALMIGSARAWKILRSSKIQTVGDFIRMGTEDDYEHLKGCGVKTAAILQAAHAELLGVVLPLRAGPCCQLDRDTRDVSQ